MSISTGHSISPDRPASAPPRGWGWRAYLAALLGFLALALLACFGSFAAAHAAQPSGDTAAEGAAPAAPEPAHWVKKKINFTYQGFTTHYSCEGLTEKVKQVLLQLGARKSDLHVHEAGCTSGFGRPEPFPTVVGTFSVLEPAASSGEAGHPVKGTWQTVDVRVGRPGLDQAGQCELIDQVKSKILPLFATRNVQFQSSCVPHQLTIKGSSLSVQVLKPASHAGKEVAEAPHEPNAG